MKVEGKEGGQASHRTVTVGPTNGRHTTEDKNYIGVFVCVLQT